MPRSPARARVRRALALLSLLAAPPLDAQTTAPPLPPPRVAALGACRLASGHVIADCRVAWRAYGPLSPARDNVVLVPTYFAGRSDDHLFMLGAYVDTTRHHVVIVDALADGYSSSPSTADAAAASFAALGIGDMVDVQHRLLTEHLGVRHLRAGVGISMGGFQACEWAVRYPDFVDAVVPIVGSPRPTTHDRLVYALGRRIAEAGTGPGADVDSAWRDASRWEAAFMRTPRFVNDSGDAPLARTVDELTAAYRATSWSLADYAAQLGAVGRHDVAARHGGSLRRAAAAVRARMLVVWSPDDRMVDPAPGAAFARLVRADTLAVRSGCGHAVYACESERIGRAVRAFLAREPGVAARRRQANSPGTSGS